MRDWHRWVYDVPRAHDFLSSQPIPVQRYDLGNDLRAARSGGCRTDRIDHGAYLFWSSAGEAPDHEVDDLRLDESRVLSGRARPRAMGCQPVECGSAVHQIESRGLSDGSRN